MAAHKDLECEFVAIANELPQQVPIGQARGSALPGQSLEISNDRIELADRHDVRPWTNEKLKRRPLYWAEEAN